MIKVYFQSEIGSHSELVAVFPTEEIYMMCLPALRWQAGKQRCFVTEIDEPDVISLYNEFLFTDLELEAVLIKLWRYFVNNPEQVNLFVKEDIHEFTKNTINDLFLLRKQFEL